MKLAVLSLVVLALVAGTTAQSAVPTTRPAPAPTSAWVCSVTVQFGESLQGWSRGPGLPAAPGRAPPGGRRCCARWLTGRQGFCSPRAVGGSSP